MRKAMPNTEQEEFSLISGRSYRVNNTFYGDILIAIIGYSDHFRSTYISKHQVLKVKVKSPFMYLGSMVTEGTELFMNKGFINSFVLCR